MNEKNTKPDAWYISRTSTDGRLDSLTVHCGVVDGLSVSVYFPGIMEKQALLFCAANEMLDALKAAEKVLYGDEAKIVSAAIEKAEKG